MLRRLLLLLTVLSASIHADPLAVSAAVSLKESLTDVAKAYREQGGGEVTFTFGASGTLTAQIRNGALVDVFISAANKQVKELTQAGVADEASRRVIVNNTLVLIAPADKKTGGPNDVADLVSDAVKKIAVGDPKVVPAGDYADQTFKTLKIDEALKPKLVYGASVRQVLAYVERGEVDAGLVYATDAREGGPKVKVIATVDEGTHEKIEYPAVIIQKSGRKDAAGKFLDYLASDKAQAIFKARGFTPPSAQGKP